MNNINQQEFSDYTVLDSHQASGTGVVAKKFMASVFLWMFVALGVSTLMAVLYASVPSLTDELLVRDTLGRQHPTMLMWIVTFAPFAFLLIMQFGMAKLSTGTLALLFIAFAAVLGISLSSVLFVYTSGSVVGCFGAASTIFGIMAFLGYTTDKDLTSWGRLLTMGLIGIVVASLINMFLGNHAIDYLISIVGVAVFTGLTAYDTQKLKRIGAGLEYEGTSTSDTTKLALMGALSLYLDFINLFLMLLRLFGNRRD